MMRNAGSLLWVLSLSMLVTWGSGCSSTSAPIEDGGLIGVLDFQKVLNQTDAGKTVTESLNNFMKERQALIELEQRELRRLENEILAQGSVLSETARKQREETFRRRMMQYQQKVADLNQEVQEKQKDLLAGFRQSVEEVVAEIARTGNLLIVVEYGKGTSTLYHQPKLDITEKVILELDRP
ncbi:MAG: OmpH family outer membrane protein [Nitrospirota bacterium]|nr:MAG: OmpH family outer membrane protein [Nitrospirota bacterium]